MHRMASSQESAPILVSHVGKIADAAAAMLASTMPQNVRTSACHLLLALSELDSDAVWLLLFRLNALVSSSLHSDDMLIQ